MRTTAVSALRAACHRAGVGWSTGGPRIGTRRTPVAATSTPHRRAGWRGIATGASDNPDRQPETRTDEEAAAAADRAAFERMTVAELKDLLRARGQRVGGKKAELVERATSPTSSVGAGFSTSTAASRDRSSSYASTAAKKKPKSPPRMVWEVTDPPLPPRAPKLDKATQPSITVLSWNVNSIRALLEKDPDVLDKLAASEDADVVVLQETKLQTKNVPELDAKVLANYPHRVWNCSTKKLGYSGTALFTKHKPLNTWIDPFEMDEFTGEGRVVVAELTDAFVVGAYCPNSGEGLKRLTGRCGAWDPNMSRYLFELEQNSGGKPVIYVGDLNVANEPIDLWGNHAANSQASGYTPEERGSFKRLLLGPRDDGGAGLVDSFSDKHGVDAKAFTYFSYRAGARPRNRGWRIDYALVSESARGEVHDAFIRGDVGGSDHCPIGVVVKVCDENDF